MAKSRDLMERNKRLAKELEARRAADEAARRKRARAEKEEARKRQQAKAAAESEYEDEEDDDDAATMLRAKMAEAFGEDDTNEVVADHRQDRDYPDADDDSPRKQKQQPPRKQSQQDQPQPQPQPQPQQEQPQDLFLPQDTIIYHPDGVGMAYRFWDAESRTWGVTQNYWVARQIGGDIISVVWVWYSDGVIDHLLSTEEIKRYLP